MRVVEHIREFLNDFAAWASAQTDVQAIAPVGFYARGVTDLQAEVLYS
jgi:hypothetical protein